MLDPHGMTGSIAPQMPIRHAGELSTRAIDESTTCGFGQLIRVSDKLFTCFFDLDKSLGVMKQSALLEFESADFAIEADEDTHTNPGVFGKALAQWLAEQLRANGVAAGEPIAEDFGWCVPVESKPHSLYVVCANTAEELNHWRVFAFAEGGIMARLLGKNQSALSVASLFATLKLVLQSTPHVRGLREEEP